MTIGKEHFYNIQRDYDQKQFQVNYERSKRVAEVYAKVPALKDIKDTIASLQISKAKNILTNNAFELENINNKIIALIHKRDQLLSGSGYSLNYLEPWYQCNDCNDTGYTEEHEMCHCFKQAVIDILYSLL